MLGSGVALAFALVSTPARADVKSCPQGNLLAVARLTDSLDVRGPIVTAWDDSVLVDGTVSNGTRGIQFQSAAGSLTFDLGDTLPIAAAFVQAEGRNRFSLQVSNDGLEYRPIWTVPLISKKGVRTRFDLFWDVRARYIRFGEPTGPGDHGLTEVQVFCEVPDPWPPAPTLTNQAAPTRAASPSLTRLTRRVAGPIKMGMAFFGAALLAWGRHLRRRGRPERFRRLRDGLLIALGLLGYAAYYNWGAFHMPGRVHDYEFFHYYTGAKYFPELGYRHLYECANLAEAEDGFRRRVELRVSRDLTDNELVPAKSVLTHPEECKRGFARPFTSERWNEFKTDVAYFRDRIPIAKWERALMDHGYNPSPAWNMTGAALANLGPASDRLIRDFLAWIDPVLVLLAFLAILWAFGWRIACIAALFFGTNALASFYWTGGAFLRQDWFLLAIGGICLLKRGLSALGGASLAFSMLLRIFPLGFFAGIGLRLLWLLGRDRRLDRFGVRIVVGAALVVAMIVPVSSLVANSFSAWPEFVRNSAKHTSTPLTNYMGLKTVLGFRWETRQKVMVDPTSVDPFHEFREARKNAFRKGFGFPLYLLFSAAYLLLLLRIAKRETDWWALAVFGFGVIPIFMELTCYYFSFLTAAALLWEKRATIPIGLLLVSGLSHVVEMQTFYYDIRFAAESVLILVFVVWATWSYARGLKARDAAAQAAPASMPAEPTVSAPPPPTPSPA